MKYLYMLVIATIILASCQSQKSEKVYAKDGVWEQEGYGQYIKITGDSASIYTYATNSCDLLEEELLEDFVEVLTVGENDLLVRKGINHYKFKRIDDLPAECINDPSIDREDPIHNFESVWQTFDQQYAYFDERDIDWGQSYEKYRSQVDANTTPVALYGILNDMLEEIGDGHVGLEPSEEVMEQYQALQKDKLESSAEDAETPKGPSIHSMRQQLKADLTDYYLDSTSIYNSGVVRWGMMKDDVAYVQINWMLLLADYKLSDTFSIEELWGAYWETAEERGYHRDLEEDGARMIIDSIVGSLSEAKAYVLDIRFNGGGKDGAALALLSPFVDNIDKTFTKKAKLENGFSKPQEISLSPAARTFDGPVYLLISPQTASAAEIMTLSSMASSNVTRIGSATEGIFSDMLDRVMPNGWTYSLSNEVYQDLELTNYENKGIPPHYELDYPRESREMYQLLSDEVKNGDRAIEVALRLAKANYKN